MAERDPFLSSLLGRAAYQRVLTVIGILAFLWLAIAWAVWLA